MAGDPKAFADESLDSLSLALVLLGDVSLHMGSELVCIVVVAQGRIGDGR